MKTLGAIKKKTEFYLTLSLSLTLIAYFWIVSRYPALNRKSGETSGGIKDVLTNWPSYIINERDPIQNKIFYSTLNWIITNKQGMLFGVALAILISTLLEYVDFKKIEKKFNSFWSGVILGTPLGVCVNCVAPISYSLAKSRKNKLLLGTMFSSPTLNIVVLSMSFAIFPFYLVTLKILFTLIFLFIVLPYLYSKEPLPAEIDSANATDSSADIGSETVGKRIYSFLHTLFKQLIIVIGATVPFMFIAGFVGVVVAYLFPITSISFSNTIGSLFLVNIVALFLPVPIIFDVILSNAIYQMGAPIEMVAACLFSLGIFSVYASIVLVKLFSYKFVMKIYVALFVCSVTASYITGYFHHSSIKNEVAAFSKEFGREVSGATTVEFLTNEKNQFPIDLISKTLVIKSNFTVKSYPFVKKNPDKMFFEKIEGETIGLDRGFQMTPRDFVEPFFYGRGTASGDYNNDHWPDIVLGSDKGLHLYMNIGGKFVRQKLDLGTHNTSNIFNVALVDLNNDGWLDLIASTYARGNFYLLNSKGSFNASKVISIPNNSGIVTMSMSFADLNHDGLLDIFNGNETFGYLRFLHKKSAYKNQSNSMLQNKFPNFNEVVLTDYPGETLASIITDIRNNGQNALYVANDYQAQDAFFDIDKNGSFTERKPRVSPLPFYPFNAMSIDTGDLDNDLIPEFFVSASTNLEVQLLNEVPSALKDQFRINENYWQKNNPKICNNLQFKNDKERCLKTLEAFGQMNVFMGMRREANISGCVKLKLDGNPYARDCAMVEMLNLAIAESQPKFCENIADDFIELKFFCENYFKVDDKVFEEQDQILSSGSTNSIFTSKTDENGKFKTMSDKYKNFSFPKKSGWTWNSKIADLDNDGLQDIFMANGLIFEPHSGWNLFMKNYGNGVFKHEEEKFNLFDAFDTFSYTLVDIDQNGTLDIVANSSTGSVRVFKNNSANNSIAFELRDHKKNYFGIGSRIYIQYQNIWQQMREIKGSGGFMSFDHPQAYFGLNQVSAIDKVKIIWSDGEEMLIENKMLANQKYIIDRL